ncbi:MAG: serine/threonine protein kinase [Planctomycetes bacterium]|nr:serine/threonine protein kinase [Planctomycetota bacterium]
MSTTQSPQRWAQVKAVFLRAAAAPAAEREMLLRELCEGDAELRRDVERLLARDSDPGELGADPSSVLGLPRFAPQRESLPESIGPYRVIRELGDGAFGVVYLAEQPRPKRLVAVKVLRAWAGSGSSLQRFERESELTARLHHPCIAQVLDVGSEPGPSGRPYLVMEYVDGPMITRFAEGRGLSVAERVRLMISVCRAVQHAHNQAIVHRDLKPSNILIQMPGSPTSRHPGEDTDGSALPLAAGPPGRAAADDPFPKILDFGVARLLGQGSGVADCTVTGQLIGTLAYMSPEQARGVPTEVDTRSDIYSVGAVLYELLAGRPPILTNHTEVPESLRAIQEDEPRRVGTLCRGCGSDLETIVHKALAKEKNRRYQSVSELADDLERFLRHEPIAARPATIAYQLSKFAGRNRAAVIAAAIVAAVSVTGAGVWWRAQAERRQDAIEIEQVAVLLDEVRDLVWPQAGTRPLREKSVNLAGPVVERFVKRHPENTAMLRTHARLVAAKASLCAEDGRAAEAAELYERARNLAERLLGSAPGDRQLMRTLAFATIRLGDLAGERSGPRASEPYYARAMEIEQLLVEAAPDDLRAADDLTWSLERLAHLAVARGALSTAAQLCGERVRAAEALLAKDPSRKASMYAAMCASGTCAGVRVRLGELDAACSQYARAVELGRQLVAGSPVEPDHVIRFLIYRAGWAEYGTSRGLLAAADVDPQDAFVAAANLQKLEPDTAATRNAWYEAARAAVFFARAAGEPQDAAAAFRGWVALWKAQCDGDRQSLDLWLGERGCR